MKKTGVLTGLILFAIGLTCFLSGCAMEYNTSARSGEAAGLAVHRMKFAESPRAYMNANTYLTYEGQHFFHIDAGIPRDNRYFRWDQFMDNCMRRCGEGNQPSYDKRFCHSYCACTSEEFRNNIPMQHLMAFGMGSSNVSQPKINKFIGMCAHESVAMKNKPARPVLIPSGNPASNSKSAPMDARSTNQ